MMREIEEDIRLHSNQVEGEMDNINLSASDTEEKEERRIADLLSSTNEESEFDDESEQDIPFTFIAPNLVERITDVNTILVEPSEI